MSTTPILERNNHVYSLNGQPVVSVSTVINALSKKSWSDIPQERQHYVESAAIRGSLIEEYATELFECGVIRCDDETLHPWLDGLERWYQRAKPELIESQKMVYSEMDGTAGTLDWILAVYGRVYMVDCKCTAQAEKTWILQLGAYWSMLPDYLPVERTAVLHINPKFKEGHKWREYDPAEAMLHWQRGLAWYRSLQTLKAEAAE